MKHIEYYKYKMSKPRYAIQIMLGIIVINSIRNPNNLLSAIIYIFLLLSFFGVSAYNILMEEKMTKSQGEKKCE